MKSTVIAKKTESIVQEIRDSKRIAILTVSFSILCLFSFYFIASYYMSLRTFQTIGPSMDGLKIIFQKGSSVSFILNGFILIVY